MRRAPIRMLFVGLLLATGACQGDSPRSTVDADGPVARGEVVEILSLPVVSISELESLAARAGIDERPRYGLEVRRVRYGTVDAHGDPTVASATVMLPSGLEGELPTLSVQHGTQTRRLAAQEINPELFGPALLFGAQGYAVIGADYLGLGEDQGVHPYYHAASEATVTLDLLRAAREVIADTDASMGEELFLAGYSQGAHVTMALHRALESDDTGFEVSGSVAMAGAYDLDEINVPHALADPAISTPMYLAYAVLGLNPIYHFAENLDDVFTEPYEETALELFEGAHTPEEITARLPRELGDLFDPPFLAELQRGRGPFFEALGDNDLDDFTPEAPVLLVHGRADADVPFASSETFHAQLAERGADVSLIELGAALTHESAAAPAYLTARDWITARRN